MGLRVCVFNTVSATYTSGDQQLETKDFGFYNTLSLRVI